MTHVSGISVIIPARNTASTLKETIESLRAQTYPDWEAIIVDDGSTDATRSVAEEFAASDPRIRVLAQPSSGVSAARNAGIAQARHEWLHFLDADDLIKPGCYSALVKALESGEYDAAYCGWARIGPGGRTFNEHPGVAVPNFFAEFARTCLFAIHACVVRRSIVASLGGFDSSLSICEDWDLWQRVARTGARFASTPEILALYRTYADTTSTNMPHLLASGLQVVARGHSYDARVGNPAPAFASGMPHQETALDQLVLLCWCAGWMIGAGKPGSELEPYLHHLKTEGISSDLLGSALLDALVLPSCRRASEAYQLWPRVERAVGDFLSLLEKDLSTPGLVSIVLSDIENIILDQADAPLPLRLGKAAAIGVEVTQPIGDFVAPPGVERLHVRVLDAAVPVGAVDIPVFEGFVASSILRDAIAARWGWTIVGRHFRRTLYPSLQVEQGEGEFSVHRGAVEVTEGLEAADASEALDRLHERAGWTVFLEELWGRPDWPQSHFYNTDYPESTAPLAMAGDDGWIDVEVSQELPDVRVARSELRVAIHVGGSLIGIVQAKAENETVRAQEIRAAINRTAGLELARAAAREALIGVAGDDRLRTRLQAAARAALTKATANDGRETRGVVLGRRQPEKIDSPLSRRAALPLIEREELIRAAHLAGEPVLYTGPDARAAITYAPDLVERANSASSARTSIPTGDIPLPFLHARGEWEHLFLTQPDPWDYSSAYEQTKYEQTLSLLPAGRIRRALELGCAEGHFTAKVASRVEQLLAADISQVALDRAAERCSAFDNVAFLRLDAFNDPLPDAMDLIICSEMLYYLPSRESLRPLGIKLAAALAPGGYLLHTHANLVVDDPEQPGYDWDQAFGGKFVAETLRSIPDLRFVRELRTRLYRIQLFKRLEEPDGLDQGKTRRRPEVAVLDFAEHTPPEPDVAAHILWKGGTAKRGVQVAPAVTQRLPILMYHQVSRGQSSPLARYRVSPEAFEEQLAYLRDSGYYSARLDDWGRALAAGQPLPGRAIVLTFDDGYQDFLTCAWPLLKRYGFTATVFLVAECVGGTNEWDRRFGEEMPLMNWAEIERLSAEGVQFGAHSASHRRLDTLSPEDVVLEAAHSRRVLLEHLGAPVSAFAYPYGGENPIVQHIVGACGFEFGLTTRPGSSRLGDSLLALPRIEVSGEDRLQDLILKLSD